MVRLQFDIRDQYASEVQDAFQEHLHMETPPTVADIKAHIREYVKAIVVAHRRRQIVPDTTDPTDN